MLKQILQDYIAGTQTTFYRADGSVHDRSQTIGGSEVGQCIRKMWFDKNGAEVDKGYVQNNGFFVRGHNVEDWVTSTAAASLPDGDQYLYIGDTQITLVDDRVSATPDGLYITADGEEVAVELKSVDPRTNLDKPKDQHVFQNQLQIELFHKLTDHSPTRGVVTYVNSSDYNHIIEHPVERDKTVLEAAHNRAEQVFNASHPLDLMPEGAWGDECRYCQFTSVCGNAVIKTFPTDECNADDFAEEVIDEFTKLIRNRDRLAQEKKTLDIQQKEIEELIKRQLRSEDVKKIKSDDWTISYSMTAPRRTLDTKAATAAGIDLEPFYKTGKSSERLTIRVKGE